MTCLELFGIAKNPTPQTSQLKGGIYLFGHCSTGLLVADHTRQRTLHKDRKGGDLFAVPFYPSHSREVSPFLFIYF